jgi:hypothetical protein
VSVTDCEPALPAVASLSTTGYSVITGAREPHHHTTAMMIDHTTSRQALEAVILENDSLYKQLDEQRLLNKGYTTEELCTAVVSWIEAGDECAACA